MAKFRKLGQFLEESTKELGEMFGETFSGASKGFEKLGGFGQDDESREAESPLALDPRFGLSGEALAQFQKERKKKRAAGEQFQAERDRTAKAFGSILTDKEQKPSLVG